MGASLGDMAPDRTELARFVSAIFWHANPDGFVALRVFNDANKDGPALHDESVRLGAPDFLDKATHAAFRAANLSVPAVFAPPIATFRTEYRARRDDLLEGLAIVAECDASPRSALDKLRKVLGPPTIVIESGGRWRDPITGEEEPKLHVYWRLAVPTRTLEEHADLRTARKLACDLVGADASAVSLVHPLRWPGSWHRKGVPRLAKIVEENDAQLVLAEALERLRAVAAGEFARQPSEGSRGVLNPEKTADSADIAAALAVIPNKDWCWNEWSNFALATWAATEGDWHAGFDAFDEWSAKSEKYNPDTTEAKWAHIATSPPTDIGAGTIFYLARKFEPGWIKPSAQFDVMRWFDPEASAEPLFSYSEAADYKITATPFAWRDPTTFPRRRWLYGVHLIRKFISCTVAPGGVGKSSLVLVEAVAMATGRPLLGTRPVEGPIRVWVVNLEDPQEEIERRVIAILLHYKIDPAEIAGRLFLDSGRRLKLIVAGTTRAGTEIAYPIVDAFTDEILARKVDVVMIDPFVKAHRVPENDNVAIDTVATVFADMADACNCAFDLVHHVRKTGGAEVTVEDGRGAVALLGAVRSARVLNAMTKDEAAKVGEAVSPREFFRADNGKLNMAPAPSNRAEWYRLVSIPLGNGDQVQCAVTWTWPDAMAGITADHLLAVQAAVAAGRWRENHQARDWVGQPVAGALGLDLTNRANKAKVLSLVKTWVKSGKLVVVSGQDERRKPVAFVEAGSGAA